MLRIAGFLIIALILIPCSSIAEIKTISATHKYVMGDNDSKNDARHICFLEAKRKVLDKAGTFIESLTETKDYRLSKDEISAYSAALLKVETIKEDWRFIGENMVIIISVKADVDTNYIDKQLAKIKTDTSIQEKIKGQQKRIQELEQTVVELRKQLGTVSSPKAATLRKERNLTFKKIDELQATKIEIVNSVKSKNRNACHLITKGMNKSDVIKIMGAPDGYNTSINLGYNHQYADEWYYGNVTIEFNTDGIFTSGKSCR
jgi:hypothetical protein